MASSINNYLETNYIHSLEYLENAIQPCQDIYIELHLKLVETYITSLQNQLSDLRYEHLKSTSSDFS